MYRINLLKNTVVNNLSVNNRPSYPGVCPQIQEWQLVSKNASIPIAVSPLLRVCLLSILGNVGLIL